MKRFASFILIGGFVLLLATQFRRSPRPPSPGMVAGESAPPAAAKPGPAVTGAEPEAARTAPATIAQALAATNAAENEAARSAFGAWADAFLAGKASTNTARGEALAYKRREAMRALIQANPAQAIAAAAPYRWHTDLPANITRHLENWVDGKGAMTVLIGTDFERGKTKVNREVALAGQTYQAIVYGRRQAQGSQTGIPLHGLALDGLMAVHEDPIRMLELAEAQALNKARNQPAEAICGVSGQPADSRAQAVAADTGGEVQFYCGVDHAWAVKKFLLTLAASGENGGFGSLATAANDAWTHGPKNVLYMRVNFPDDLTEPISEAAAHSVMNGVNGFYTAGSYDVTALLTTVTPLMTLPQTKAWYSTAGPGALIDDARAAARLAGFETGNYPLDIVAFTSVPDYDFGGLAAVHGKSVWLQSTGEGVTAHELGHNYGLWHANFWIATNSIIGLGTNHEYGNIFDTMGPAGGGNSQFNAMHKNILNWLPDPSVHSITSNGVYRIYPFDSPQRKDDRFYAAKVAKDYQRDYWLEFRANFANNPLAENPWLDYGVTLNWSPWEQSAGGTHLLDTTPGTLTREDSAVTIGRTFTDPNAGVHITPLARGATGTEPYLDVQVNLGDYPGNWPPFLAVEIDPTNAAVGQLVHFHATAEDLDGDTLAYAWTFDDGTFSTNNQPWAFKSWSSPGEHVVRCVVSDMKGGSASANAVVTVSQPTGYRVTGIILDANDDPIEGVRVDTGITNTEGYVVGYTDSDGVFVLTGVNSDLNLEATKYGYTFANATWQNPLSVTSNTLHIDFQATAMPTVRITTTTNRVSEADGGEKLFTLTRTGELTNELSVTVYLSGTADTGGDYSLAPPMDFLATNIVLFPAGTQSVTVAFQALNDGTGENDETCILTILEDTAYVIAAPGIGTITIVDDDAAARPAVSVAAVTPTIPENGMDRGTFLFSRNGNTRNALTVFYTVAGTATAGTDYASLSGVAEIPAGKDSVAIQFKTFDDKILEPDETVIATVAANAAYTVGAASAETKIVNDDLLSVTIFPAGNGVASEGGGAGIVTVQRNGDLTGNLTVFYTVGGVAVGGSDFQPPSGAVTIPSGAASADIVLVPINDNEVEGDESVIFTVTTNIAYNIGTPGVARMVIRDDEKIIVSVETVDDEASEPGDNTGSFQVTRSGSASGNLTVNLAISGTAIAGADYVPLDNPVVIPDGANSITVDVIAFDDLHQEPEEDVRVSVLPSANYNIGNSQARIKIVDDDANNVPAVGFSFATSSARENQSPGISVTLSATSSSPITVEYVVLGGTASASDYSLPPPPLTFEAGQRAISIPLSIVNDTEVEPNETIRLALFNPIGATLDGIKIHTYTIVDDDMAAVSVTATAANATETGTSGNFRITRAGATNAALLVGFELTGSASAPGDYAAVSNQVVIPAGALFADVPIVPVNDATVEPEETVRLTLLTASGGKVLSPNVATVTITDNETDGLPAIAVTTTNKPNAVEGGGTGEFVFTRTGSTTGALTCFFTVSGTASSPADYPTLPGTFTFNAGQNSVALPVSAVDDTLIEGEETVIVSLSVTNTYRVAYPSSATVTIQDNDQRVWVDASDFEAAEPGTDTGEVTFTRFGTTNTPLQVFFTLSGKAINGTDYATLGNSFTIPAGQLSAPLVITALDDALVEGHEALTLTLQNNAAYTLGTPTAATVTILDDEPLVSIVANPTNILEGAARPAIFTVRRGGNPDHEFTARLAITGTATRGVDYPPLQTDVFFGCGVVAIDLALYPTNELAAEDAETVIATLVPHPSYTILSPSNAVVIIEDAASNLAPLVRFTSPTADTIYLLGTNVGIILEATVTDDGDTNTPITLTWTNMSGPNSLVFANADQITNTVTFTNSGVYVLRLTANDGFVSEFAELTVVVDAVAQLTTNLLHWTFDEGAGADVLDVSGYDHHGTIAGAPDWRPDGVTGGALHFNGTDNFVRELEDSGLLMGLKQFSLAMWIKPDVTNVSAGLFTANTNTTADTWSLSLRSDALCGAKTNVLAATFATTRTVARQVTASNATTNGWQHVTLTWSNGLASALYLNGQLGQPGQHGVPLRGFITNSPQFVIGRGAADLANGWRGMVDDVRVFPRFLSAAEVGGFTATNFGAFVEVATNLTVPILTPVELSGIVTDDGRPNPPGMVSNTWIQISGPLPITLTNFNGLTNTVEFTLAGEYVFRLIADDGQVKVFKDLPVTVIEPTQISVFASDGDAAELGGDPGEVIFERSGDLDFDMTVFVTLTGTASNGADVVSFPFGETIVLPAGTQSVAIAISPFLDDRTEGDETLIFTIVSNVSYTIGSPSATVTIHDSPYGVWNIAHFTLEELTDPSLSGPDADFDKDRRFNFAEYAANLNPKGTDTNAPLVSVIETNHITFTYQRRLPPTDVAYETALSYDMFNWLSGPEYLEELSVTDDGNMLTETVKARIVAPYATTNNTFIKVTARLLTTGP